MNDKPNWAATEAPGPETELTIEPVDSLSAEERIKRARERGIELSKRNNSIFTFGFNHDRDYWTDFAGTRTSEFDAKLLLSQLSLLQEPRFMNWKETRWVNSDGYYDRRKSCWVSDKSLVPLAHMRAAIDARIRELGLDPILVAEHYASPHSIEEHREFLNLSFEEQMQRFRSPAVTTEKP